MTAATGFASRPGGRLVATATAPYPEPAGDIRFAA